MKVTPLWSYGLGPVVRVHRGLERKCSRGGYAYGFFPDGDHTIGGGERGGGLRTRIADAYRLGEALQVPQVLTLNRMPH